MIPRTPIKTDAQLFDAAVAKIQNLLGANILWLDHIFGICERLTDIKDGKKFHSANVYVGNGKYEQIMPCAELGNFCFFYLRDSEDFSTRREDIITSPFSLVFWYDVDKVSSSPSGRNKEAVKAQILSVLRYAHITGVTLELSRIYEKPESVFSEYSYDHTANQFLMHPYSGFRIDGTIAARIPCGIPTGVETYYLRDENHLLLCDKNGNKLIYRH